MVRVQPQLTQQAAPVDITKVLERVHAVLYDQVGIASEAVSHLEKSWSASEMTKRVVRYIYNAAKSGELMSMHFEEACDQFVKFAMGSYQAACGEKEWFFEMDLAPAFAAAAWELLRGQRGLRFEQVQAKTRAAFEEFLDTVMLNKGMWEASSNTFKDPAVHNKIFAAVQKAHQPAFDATIMDARPRQELERVQDFLKRWINDSMTRAWNSVGDAERVLTVANVSRLFQNMLAPYGPDHPYSTIPSVLTERIGPPPRNWAFVNNEVKSLFASWRQEASRSQPAAKRRKTNTLKEEQPEPEVDAPVQAEVEPVEAEAEEAEEGAAPQGHPSCTSAEDCIGTASAKLVRHLLDGVQGDIYCMPCWDSFLQQNSSLEGELLDD